MKIELLLILISLILVPIMWIGLLSPGIVINIHFYLLILMAIINFKHLLKISLYQVWIAAFIFIILSEMLIIIADESDVNSYITSFSYLLLANDFVLLGYHSYKNKANNNKIYKIYNIEKKNLLLLVIILGIILYISGSVSSIISNIILGRQTSETTGSTSLIGILTKSLGLILPAIIAFYYKYIIKKNVWKSMFFILPIISVQILLSTRFHLLFSLLPYFIIIGIIDLNNFSLKKLSYIFILFICFILLSSLIKEYRKMSLIDLEIDELTEENEINENDNITTLMAREMSPEGVVFMTRLANEYFEDNQLTYGKEISFILYFWVPRSIWPDKPTPIDHWLIRKYYNVSEGHSTASGFTGELRADFGLFSLFIVFLGGMLLKRGDLFVENVFFNQKGFNLILASCLYPYVFFLVRSPLTATQTLIFELLIFYLLRFLLSNNKANKF